jgi:pyruvate,water dikinase
MSFIIKLGEIAEGDLKRVGGKAFSLANLLKNDFPVPSGYVITTDAFDEFLDINRLRPKINLELSRKSLEKMRWEEIWDASLRIKNMIIKGVIPNDLVKLVEKEIINRYSKITWVVRSSSIAEDSHSSSFAGLHESYLNIKDLDELLVHLKLVWASLFSDGALMYRKELGLDLDTMSMAVVLQEFSAGESSGICFSMNPMNKSQAIVESVYGLNQALVDGDIEPDRWLLERNTGRILEHKETFHTKKMVALETGVDLTDIQNNSIKGAPLSDDRVIFIYNICRKSEDLFHTPQDMEWTQVNGEIKVLQSRPITEKPQNEDDQRPWYLSLTRTFKNLEELKKKIENDLIPKLIKTSEELEKIDIKSYSDEKLSKEILKRKELLDYWTDIYWDEFIPFAHGMRLFGSVYNERLKPEDPYEFMMLLQGQELQGIKRNKKLMEISKLIFEFDKTSMDSELHRTAQKTLNNEIDDFIKEFPEIMLGSFTPPEMRNNILKLAKEFEETNKETQMEQIAELERSYFEMFPKNEREYAAKLLDIGRASYLLRDNDNIYMGRLERCLEMAVELGYQRVKHRLKDISLKEIPTLELIRILSDPSYQSDHLNKKAQKSFDTKIRVSQIVGQPASKGIVSGYARVIQDKKDLFDLKKGEILVVDAIDPTMTFVVPLCAGIIERRGGMLIHGAIIAREYHIPCVTGIADATKIIETGNMIHLDGENGIVAIRPVKPRPE